jgi:hypothetical protein
MSSQETDHVSPTEVTPELGKGALDTWWLSRPSIGRLDKTGTYAVDGSRRRGCEQTSNGRGAYEPAFKPLQALGRLTEDTPRFQTGPGKSGRPAL